MTREVKTRGSPVIISNETFLAYLHRFIAIMMDALMIMIILKSHLIFRPQIDGRLNIRETML